MALAIGQRVRIHDPFWPELNGCVAVIMELFDCNAIVIPVGCDGVQYLMPRDYLFPVAQKFEAGSWKAIELYSGWNPLKETR